MCVVADERRLCWRGLDFRGYGLICLRFVYVALIKEYSTATSVSCTRLHTVYRLRITVTCRWVCKIIGLGEHRNCSESAPNVHNTIMTHMYCGPPSHKYGWFWLACFRPRLHLDLSLGAYAVFASWDDPLLCRPDCASPGSNTGVSGAFSGGHVSQPAESVEPETSGSMSVSLGQAQGRTRCLQRGTTGKPTKRNKSWSLMTCCYWHRNSAKCCIGGILGTPGQLIWR